MGASQWYIPGVLWGQQEDKTRSVKHVEALHLRVKEYKEEVALTKQEAKSLKKSLKLSEVPSV